MGRVARGVALVLVMVALAWWALRPKAPASPDWREVTVDGFQAGVTRADLEARLGPAHEISGTDPYGEGSQWTFQGQGTYLILRRGSFSLHGSRLECRGRRLEAGSVAEVVRELGKGQLVPQPIGGIRLPDTVTDELVYQASDCQHKLVVRLLGGKIESFALRWRAQASPSATPR